MASSKEQSSTRKESRTVDAVKKQNPGVDPVLLEKYRQSRRELEKLGCERKADYRLAPALGGTVIRSMGRQMHE